MTIQLAPHTQGSPGPRAVAAAGTSKPASPQPPRVLQSARAPAQLSFFFKRG